MIEFDKPFTFNKVWADYHLVETHLELQSNHVGAAIGFSTKKGEQVHAKVASSFISPEQAELNLKEIGNKTFEQTKEAGRKAWNDVLGRMSAGARVPFCTSPAMARMASVQFLVGQFDDLIVIFFRIHFVKPPSLRFISFKIIVGVAKRTNAVNGQDERLRRH